MKYEALVSFTMRESSGALGQTWNILCNVEIRATTYPCGAIVCLDSLIFIQHIIADHISGREIRNTTEDLRKSSWVVGRSKKQ